MTLRIPLLLLAAAAVYAQAPASSPPKDSSKDVPAATVVATVDGKKITAGELESILRAFPPQNRQSAMQNPKQFLAQFGLLRKLSDMAEQAKLYERSPLKEQLEYNRMVALAQAKLLETQSGISVGPEELQKQYEASKDQFTQAKVKVIYLPFSDHPPDKQEGAKKVLSEPEAKAKAEKLVAEIRSGADFVKLVKEHSGDPVSASKDGDFGTIHLSDRVPEEVKKVVFALKAGDVSEPVRQPNGYYLFRLEETGLQPFDEVKEQLGNDVRMAKFRQWMETTQNSIEVKIDNEAFFNPAAPAAAPPAAPEAK